MRHGASPGAPLLVAALATFLGCASGGYVTKSASASVRPSWIDRPPSDASLVYFVGSSVGAETLAEGQDRALKDALAKISQFIGVSVQAEFESHATEVQRSQYTGGGARTEFESHATEVQEKLSHQIKTRTSAAVYGLAPVDTYHEKTTRAGSGYSLERYDAWVLLSYSKKAVESERTRQAADAARRASSGLELFESAQAAARSGLWQQALPSYRQALGLLDGLEPSVALRGKGVRTVVELRGRIKGGIDQALAGMRRVSAKVKVTGPPEAALAFKSALLAELSAHGFQSEESAPYLEIRGEVLLVRGGEAMGQRVFAAEGSVSAVGARDRRVSATVSVAAKGFHKMPTQAAIMAAEEGGKAAGEELAAELERTESEFLEQSK